MKNTLFGFLGAITGAVFCLAILWLIGQFLSKPPSPSPPPIHRIYCVIPPAEGFQVEAKNGIPLSYKIENGMLEITTSEGNTMVVSWVPGSGCVFENFLNLGGEGG